MDRLALAFVAVVALLLEKQKRVVDSTEQV